MYITIFFDVVPLIHGNIEFFICSVETWSKRIHKSESCRVRGQASGLGYTRTIGNKILRKKSTRGSLKFFWGFYEK